MATTPTAPVSAPTSAPSSAPSSSPSSAPSSAPSVASTPTPVAVPAATPAVAPVATPAAVEAPAAVPAVTKGPEPKAGDFSNDVDGQTAFLNAHHKWDQEEGEAAPAEVTAPETTAPAGETKDPLAETKKDEKEPELLAEPQAVTPEVVNSWLQKDPAFKAAVEASPEIKRQLFAMARTNAKLAPMAEIFPNVESAKFANEKSHKYVDMRSGFIHAIDNPETFPAAFEQFAGEFMVTDKDGKPVLDQAGHPTFGKDFDMMMQHVVASDLDQDIAHYAALVEKSDDDDDNMALAALKFVKELKEKKTQGPTAPDVSTLTPAQRAWQEQKEAELAARGEKLEGAAKAQTAEQKKAERGTYTQNVNRKIGSAVGKRMDTFLGEKAQEGVFLPSYVTDVKDPKTGQSMFAMQIFDEFNAKTQSVSYIKDHLKMLERLPPSAEAEKQRVDYNLQLIDEFMPDIMDKHLRQVQRTEIADRAKRSGNFEKRKDVASVEPSGGSTVQPQAFTDQSAMDQAYKTVDQKYPNIDRAERLERALVEKNRLRSVR